MRDAFKAYRRVTPGTFGEVVGRAYDQAGGVKRAAEICGRADKTLYAARDPDPEDPKATRLYYEDARRLSAAGVTALAEDLALQCGGVFVPGLAAQAGDQLAQAAAWFGREAGEAIANVFAAVSDGQMSRDEALGAIPELDDALRALTSLRAHVSAIADPARGQLREVGGSPPPAKDD
jgi:hypothetical protein